MDNMERKNKCGLFLSARQISWLLSSFIILSFFVFLSGYFLGKKKAADKFYNKVSQDSFSDQIYYSVCSMYENDEACVGQESTEDNADYLHVCKNEENGREVQTALNTDSAVVSNDLRDEASVRSNLDLSDSKGADQVVRPLLKEDCQKYYAELIGFGTLRCANKFASKLKSQGFSVIVKRRRSKTSKGKRIVWYQVVSEKFDNKNDLIAFVDIIKEKERLKGIRIVEC